MLLLTSGEESSDDHDEQQQPHDIPYIATNENIILSRLKKTAEKKRRERRWPSFACIQLLSACCLLLIKED